LISRIIPLAFCLFIFIGAGAVSSHAGIRPVKKSSESKINKIIRVGYLRDFENEKNGFSISVIMNRFVASDALAGFALGMEKVDNDYLIPIYFDYRNYIESPEKHLYFWGNAGYSLGIVEYLDGPFHGGVMLGIGFGAQFASSYSTHYSFEIGLKYQMQDTGIIASYYDYVTSTLYQQTLKERIERKMIVCDFVAWLDL